MALFGSLKKTLKHINSEMAEIKKVQPLFLFKSEIFDPAPNIPCLESEEIEMNISEMKSSLKNLRIATLKFEANFKGKQDVFKHYWQDFEDFYLELDFKSTVVEKRLVQFGYCPPKKDIPVEEDSEKVSETLAESDVPQPNIDTTPKLKRTASLCELLEKAANFKKEEPKTPVLMFDLGNKVSTKP